jgi:hypothetical protein
LISRYANMTENKNDMFSGELPKPDDKKLLEYLNGFLSDAERQAFEDQVPGDPFLQDAVEGLHSVENKAGLTKVVNSLNHQLHHHLSHKRSRRNSRYPQYGAWIYWSIGVVLLLAIAGFLVLRFVLKQ